MGMALLMTVPWLMFFMINIVFSFAYHHYCWMVWFVVIAWFAVSLMFVFLKNRMKGQWFYFIGHLCLLACVLGSTAGLYNYYSHMFQYWSYDENRAYTNVLPTEPAASHADAGKIVFANSARVDTTRAVGFKMNTVFCVAPILDDTQLDRVEYWAAGTDCCPMRGDFNCDSAWDASAKSGVVILDSTENSWLMSRMFTTRRDYFLRAAKQAEATYSLGGAKEPLFVRWVSSPQEIQDDYWRSGIGWLLATTCVYLLLSIIAGGILQMWSRRSATAQGGPMSGREDE